MNNFIHESVNFATMLNDIHHPSQIQNLKTNELLILAKELREFIIHTILENGGHFAANLGVIELTIALLNQYDLNSDCIVWDVGHQSYPYKTLTNRLNDIENIRNFGGISGFPKITESQFDAFGTGHSSTAISAVMGMAQAAQIDQLENHYIAVVGDGALTGGMSYEALNNLWGSNLNVTIILNDNQIGIDPNTGALNHHLIQENIERIQKWIEWFGLHYSGPIDGHNIADLTSALMSLKKIKGPKLLHVKTIKGKGYEPAEKEQTRYHSTNKYVKIQPNATPAKKWQDVFGEILIAVAEKYPQVVGITPAMPSSCGMSEAMNKFPHRFFDVGISEQHAVTFAAGLATTGKIPIVNIYSTFLQRAYDQLIHDVALQNLPVIFCVDRAGLVGEDGPTHHGAFDISFLNCIPNIDIFAPQNAQELCDAICFGVENRKPIAIRYPKGTVHHPDWILSESITDKMFSPILTNRNQSIAILSTGQATNLAKKAVELGKLNVDHIHFSQIKPLPILDLSKYSCVITIEDGSIQGGFGEALEINQNFTGKWIHLGIPNEFVTHGSNEILYETAGYGVNSIIKMVQLHQ